MHRRTFPASVILDRDFPDTSRGGRNAHLRIYSYPNCAPSGPSIELGGADRPDIGLTSAWVRMQRWSVKAWPVQDRSILLRARFPRTRFECGLAAGGNKHVPVRRPIWALVCHRGAPLGGTGGFRASLARGGTAV